MEEDLIIINFLLNKFILIVILIVNIFIITNYYYENYSYINYDNLTDEEKKIIEEALKNIQTNVRYLAATDIEAILNVSNIIKNGSIPITVGSIIAYYSVEVPQGWALCNGQTVNRHKTPDLRNRFVVSTGNKNNLNATGGSENTVVVSHNHSMNDAGDHRHRLAMDNDSGGLSNGGPRALRGEKYHEYSRKKGGSLNLNMPYIENQVLINIK